MAELVELFTWEGGTVLDPFMGSGTTGLSVGTRQFVGIEKEPEYFGIAQARLAAHPIKSGRSK